MKGLAAFAKDLADFELLVGADWSCLLVVGLVANSESRLAGLLAIVWPPLPIETLALPFGLRRRSLPIYPFLATHFVVWFAAVGAPALGWGWDWAILRQLLVAWPLQAPLH